MSPRPRDSDPRVLSGAYRGRRLRYPRGTPLRPTMQRVKEAVFDSIGADLTAAVFADLFAAAGGVGIEALSRGAARAVFVERDADAVTMLRANLEHCGVDASAAEVRRADVLEFLASGALRDAGATVVFADPPYDDDVQTLLEHLAAASYPQLRVVVVEHRAALGEVPARLEILREKRYGDTRVTYLAPAEGDDA